MLTRSDTAVTTTMKKPDSTIAAADTMGLKIRMD